MRPDDGDRVLGRAAAEAYAETEAVEERTQPGELTVLLEPEVLEGLTQCLGHRLVAPGQLLAHPVRR